MRPGIWRRRRCTHSGYRETLVRRATCRRNCTGRRQPSDCRAIGQLLSPRRRRIPVTERDPIAGQRVAGSPTRRLEGRGVRSLHGLADSFEQGLVTNDRSAVGIGAISARYMPFQAPGHQLAERLVGCSGICEQTRDVLRISDGGDDQVAPGCHCQVRSQESTGTRIVQSGDQYLYLRHRH